MKACIFTNQPFPYGFAATNRIKYHAKGLSEHNIPTEVCIIGPTEWGIVNNQHSKGVVEGIKFRYLPQITTVSDVRESSWWSPVKQAKKVYRSLLRIIGLIKAIIYLFHMNTNDIAIFYLLEKPMTFFILNCAAKIKKIKTYLDVCELPYFDRLQKNPSHLFRLYLHLHIRYLYNMLDGLIVISANLCDFLQSHGISKSKILLIPILFDQSEFGKTKTVKSAEKKEVVFAGAIEGKKDGFEFLLSAVHILREQGIPFTLTVIENYSQTVPALKLKEIISSLQSKNIIKILRNLSRAEYINTLYNAEILVLPKPNNFQNKYNLPSKLAEFLATGNPVIASNTSDISKYLTDRKEIYLYEPDNQDKFISTFKEVYSGLANSTVGIAGKTKASLYFDYRGNAKKLADFFKK